MLHGGLGPSPEVRRVRRTQSSSVKGKAKSRASAKELGVCSGQAWRQQRVPGGQDRPGRKAETHSEGVGKKGGF